MNKENMDNYLTQTITMSNNPLMTDDYSQNDKYLQIIKVLSVGLFGIFVLSYAGDYSNIFDFFTDNFLTGAFTASTESKQSMIFYFAFAALSVFGGLVFREISKD